MSQCMMTSTTHGQNITVPNTRKTNTYKHIKYKSKKKCKPTSECQTSTKTWILLWRRTYSLKGPMTSKAKDKNSPELSKTTKKKQHQASVKHPRFALALATPIAQRCSALLELCHFLAAECGQHLGCFSLPGSQGPQTLQVVVDRC